MICANWVITPSSWGRSPPPWLSCISVTFISRNCRSSLLRARRYTAIGKPFTVFAIVGMINAINTSDGLDGLAGGMSLLSLGCIAYLAFLADSGSIVMIAMPLPWAASSDS
jgi:UDP-N-acetylmuramyl pentapeptide phosphotransferase/UDP-N-acetylglucosamine-1-phosphate transferase